MKEILYNPVYHALLSGDKHLSFGNENVKYFNKEVSPFVGFEHQYAKGFSDLHDILPDSHKILYAHPSTIAQPAGWQINHEIKGLQFVYENGRVMKTEFNNIVPLNKSHVEQMVQLARLTKPGPFATKTIDFGSYFGIFENEDLVAMTGQRLHVDHYTEVSAVCTHPEHTSKGYAFDLMQHQMHIILEHSQQPFLHVREDNQRAIILYKRLGFAISRPMNFYFMKKV